MLAFGFYLLKVILCSGILFGYYWFLLRNKIYHRYNRFYLLAIVAVAITTPLIHINILHKQDTSAQTIKILQVLDSPADAEEKIVTSPQNMFTIDPIVKIAYLLTSLILTIIFILGLLKIKRLLKKHQQELVYNICLVNTTEKGTPFSFFKYIFWNEHIDISTTTGNQVFRHELAHVQQKHSYDKLFINVVLIFFWCNPVFWLVRKELNMIHEFMADKIAVEDSDTKAFAAMILQATYPQYRFPLTNPFFYSPIKRRLIMLTKNKNSKAGYLARVLVLPLAVLLFAAFTLKTKSIKNDGSPVYTGKKITVVIDAGHGGKDIGAKSMDGTVMEKDLALSIIKKIKAQNMNDNIDIILTRDEDNYHSVQQRVEFSKANHADLFISIHVDATADKSVDNNHSGMSIWVAKDNFKNASGSKIFASALIQEFNNDYKIPVLVEFPQQRKNGIWVLQENDCPAVVIETGFITNKTDLAYLQTDEAKETIAKNVLNAIKKYASQHTEESAQLSADTIFIDTVPKTASNKIPVEKNSLPTNTLYILDGKIIGNGKVAVAQIDKLVDNKHMKSINVIILKPEASLKKYGVQGKDGAVEITSVPKENNKINASGLSFNKDSVQDTRVFTEVQNEAEFPGGSTAWKNYYQKKLDSKLPSQDNWGAGSYVVEVSFIVKKDGSLTDIKTDTYPESKTAQACVDLIKKGPKWVPARQNGQIVTAYKKQTFSFMLADK